MISALLGGAVGLVRKPAFILPGIIAGLIVTISFFLFFETTILFVIDLVANSAALAGGGSILSVPYLILASYPYEVVSLGGFAFLIIATNIWVLQAFAIAERNEKAGVVEVVAGAFSKIQRIAFTAISLMCLAVLYVAATFVFFAIIDILSFVPFLPPLLVLFWVLLSAYLYLKFLFFGTISVSEENIKGRDLLMKTWKWSNGKLIGIIIFSLVVALIGNFILGAGFTASDFFDEFAGYIVIMLFYALGAAYSSFAFVKYYFHSKE